MTSMHLPSSGRWTGSIHRISARGPRFAHGPLSFRCMHGALLVPNVSHVYAHGWGSPAHAHHNAHRHPLPFTPLCSWSSIAHWPLVVCFVCGDCVRSQQNCSVWSCHSHPSCFGWEYTPFLRMDAHKSFDEMLFKQFEILYWTGNYMPKED